MKKLFFLLVLTLSIVILGNSSSLPFSENAQLKKVQAFSALKKPYSFIECGFTSYTQAWAAQAGAITAGIMQGYSNFYTNISLVGNSYCVMVLSVTSVQY